MRKLGWMLGALALSVCNFAVETDWMGLPLAKTGFVRSLGSGLSVGFSPILDSSTPTLQTQSSTGNSGIMSPSAGRVYKILPLGTSITEGDAWTASNGQLARDGTGNFISAGWRDWFKKIMCAVGVSNWYFVGSKTSNQGFLTEYHMDYLHDGTGGSTLAAHELIVASRVTTYLPDVLIWESGINDGAGEGVTYWENRFIEAFRKAFDVKPDLVIVAVSRTPQKQSSGAWDVNSTAPEVVKGQENAVNYWRGRGKTIQFVNVMQSVREYWYGCPTGLGPGAWGNGTGGADWYNDANDTTHFNEPGNYWLAMCIARACVGVQPFAAIGKRPVTTNLVTGTAGALANDFEYPEGAYIKKTTAADVLQVLTVYGDYVLLNATTWPTANEIWDVPVVRIYKNNSTVNGTIVVQRMPYGTWY